MKPGRCIVLFLASVAVQSCGAIPSNSCEGIAHEVAVRKALEARQDLVFGSGANPRFASFATAPITEVRLAADGYAAKVTFTDSSGRTMTTLIHTDCYIGWTASDPNADQPSVS